MTPTITCFGEILWDVLPTGKQAGGAPMNVTFHLRQFGLNAQLISRVGTDDFGRELLDFLGEKSLPTEYVQIGQAHLTGVAKANVSDRNEITYKIVQPVAWDYIQAEPALVDLVRQSDVFVYGSLAARSPLTRETLNTLLPVARRKVFDVNLRAPHYDRPVVEALLQQAHIVKLNEHELAEIGGWYGAPEAMQQAMMLLYEKFNLEALCVTLGADGAMLLHQDGFISQAGFPVQVEDTIGSGDAFLAAFLSSYLQKEDLRKTLEFACATGAYVATQRGATPAFTRAHITALLQNQQHSLPTKSINTIQ